MAKGKMVLSKSNKFFHTKVNFVKNYALSNPTMQYELLKALFIYHVSGFNLKCKQIKDAIVESFTSLLQEKNDILCKIFKELFKEIVTENDTINQIYSTNIDCTGEASEHLDAS